MTAPQQEMASALADLPSGPLGGVTGTRALADTPGERGPTIFISAAEPSADLHGASFIRAVQAVRPEVRFIGIAGPQMQAAGCEAVFDMTAHAAMLGGIFGAAPKALAMLRRSRQSLAARPFDLAVVIDSPVLNLPVAKRARQRQVPVLYYIAPQTWAWGPRRIHTVKARVDRLAVILPFEEAYFRGHGLPADYVGHPLFDALTRRVVDDEKTNALRRLGRPLVAILPGSRTHVVQEVFPGQVEVAAAIQRRYPGAHFVVSQANEGVGKLLSARLAESGLPHTVLQGANGEILSAADLVLVASGTATLEVAYYHAPMIVMYNATRLGYHLYGRWVITTKYFSLVNILAGRRLVPEYMPFYRSTTPIIADALALLDTPGALARVRQELADLLAPMVKTGASANAASIALEMLASRAPSPA